jgi:hypothetical protein
VALENVPVGTRIIGGLVALSLLLALMSDRPPDNDAWLEGEAAAASASSAHGAGGLDDDDDDACAGMDDGDGDPWTTACGTDDGTADEYAYDWSADAEGDEAAGGTGDDAGDGVGLPACDSAAPFYGPGGVVVLPSDVPLPVMASAECRLDPATGDIDAIASLQRALAVCNGEPVAVDGVYGPETRGAVADVQAGHDLTVDGAYGPATAVAMTWPLAGGRASGDGSAPAAACGLGPAHPD